MPGFVLLQPNSRLKVLAANAQEKARRRFLRTGHKARVFTSVRYRARERWSRSYRVVVKAEHHAQGPNVRFVVTTRSRARRFTDPSSCGPDPVFLNDAVNAAFSFWGEDAGPIFSV